MKNNKQTSQTKSDEPNHVRCPECSINNPPDAVFCCGCGNYIGNTIICRNCGKAIPIDSTFCCYCGEKIKSAGQMSEAWIEKQLAHSLNIANHPILNESVAVRNDYFSDLKKLVDQELAKKYILEEERCFPEMRLQYYRSIFCTDNVDSGWLFSDLLEQDCHRIMGTHSVAGGTRNRGKGTQQNQREFAERQPYYVIVTATMSAGKSTFINALAGKPISGVKAMACTGRIHEIVSKPEEDGITSRYDNTLIFDADSNQLLSDDEQADCAVISIGTYLSGGLGGKRLVILDTPGINAYEHPEHCELTQRVISSGDGDLVIFIINASQSTTEDNKEYLQYLKSVLGGRRIIFVVNKIDTLRSEEGTTPEMLCDLIRDNIISAGFDAPVICPVSARAAYLAKAGKAGALTDKLWREFSVMQSYFEENDMNEFWIY